MWQKRMWMRLECMRRTDLVRGDLAGRARVGIGTHGSTDSLSFLEMEFSIAPSAGDFTRRGMCMARRFMDTATDATATGGTIIITSARTCIAGGPEPITSRARITRAGFTVDRDRWDAAFSLGLGRPADREASEAPAAVDFRGADCMEAGGLGEGGFMGEGEAHAAGTNSQKHNAGLGW